MYAKIAVVAIWISLLALIGNAQKIKPFSEAEVIQDTANEGQPKTLNCQLTPTPPSIVTSCTWSIKDKDDQNPGNLGMIEPGDPAKSAKLQPDRYTLQYASVDEGCQLIISQVQAQDEKRFTCQISTSGSEEKHVTYELTVPENPPDFKFKYDGGDLNQQNQIVNVNANPDILLQCIVGPSRREVEFKWDFQPSIRVPVETTSSGDFPKIVSTSKVTINLNQQQREIKATCNAIYSAFETGQKSASVKFSLDEPSSRDNGGDIISFSAISFAFTISLAFLLR